MSEEYAASPLNQNAQLEKIADNLADISAKMTRLCKAIETLLNAKRGY